MTDYKKCISLLSALIHHRYSYQSQPIQSSHIGKTFAFKLIFISVRFSCDICVMLPQRLHSLQNFAVCYIQHCSRKLSLIKKIVAPLLTCYQLRLEEKQKARSQVWCDTTVWARRPIFQLERLKQADSFSPTASHSNSMGFVPIVLVVLGVLVMGASAALSWIVSWYPL